MSRSDRCGGNGKNAGGRDGSAAGRCGGREVSLSALNRRPCGRNGMREPRRTESCGQTGRLCPDCLSCRLLSRCLARALACRVRRTDRGVPLASRDRNALEGDPQSRVGVADGRDRFPDKVSAVPSGSQEPSCQCAAQGQQLSQGSPCACIPLDALTADCEALDQAGKLLRGRTGDDLLQLRRELRRLASRAETRHVDSR